VYLAVTVGAADADRSTDSAVVHQFLRDGTNVSHMTSVEAVDKVSVVSDQALYDAGVGNRASAHTSRLYAQYKSLPGFIVVMPESGSPDYAGDRVSDFHEDPYFGTQGPQRMAHEVM